jgi:hypothetical protein
MLDRRSKQPPSLFPTELRFQEALAKSLGNLSDPVIKAIIQEAEALRRRKFADLEKVIGDFGPLPSCLRYLAGSYAGMASLDAARGKPTEAVEGYRKAIATYRRFIQIPERAMIKADVGAVDGQSRKVLRQLFMDPQPLLKSISRVGEAAKLAEHLPQFAVARAEV